MQQKTSITVAVMVILALPALAFGGTISFNITYNDVVNNTNVGFDDPGLGLARRTTFESVFTYLNSVLNESGVADILVEDSEIDGSGFLASAGPYFSGSPNGFQNGSAFTHITTGVDPFGGVEDINTTFDFGYNWNSETDAPTGSEYDLFTVALHELTHGLGFLSLLRSTGLSAIGPLPGTNPGVFSVYDSFLERGDGTALFGAGGNYLGNAADLISNDVFFDGPNATAANGGNPVPIYSPNPFKPGSSISHVTGAGRVMQFSIGTGTERRAYKAAELGILADIGYNLAGAAVVPLPSTLGLGGVGLVLLLIGRHRRASRLPSQN